LNLTPFELHFGRKPSVSHLRPFGCKCFVLKRGDLDKFESCSSDGILLGYTPHGRSYRVFNLETNTIVESCNVAFDKTAPYPHDVFECAGDKEMEESIFIDEELQGFDCDEGKPLLPFTSSLELVPTSTLEADAPQATTSSTATMEVSQIEGEIISEQGAPSHIQKAHPAQQIIGNLNERVTWSSRLAHLSYFTNTFFVRHNFLRDHVEKGDIVMKYINTKRRLTDIFIKPLDATHFASLRGNLVFPIPMAWFEGELVFYFVYTPSYF
jgi:hypothetical protein